MTSILSQVSIIIEAFLYTSKPDDVQEFKPVEGDLSSSLLKLIKCIDEKRKLSVAMALHIHYQSCRLLNVSDEELIKYRSIVAKLNVDFGAKEYAQVYNHSSPQINVNVPAELSDFASPLLLPETILNILHGKVTNMALPKIESLFAYASVDSDAARYISVHCFHVYALSGTLVKSLLSGQLISDDQDHQRTFALCSDKLNSEFRLLLMANMASQSEETKSDKPCNHERISNGYLNPTWDWNDKMVDPSVRFVYNFLRVDKPHDVWNVSREDLEFKGSSELSCFHSQYMNKVAGKLFGCAVLLHGTFPDVLPESLPHAHFDTTIKLNGIVQQPIDSVNPSFKEWTSFCMAVNETLRLLNQENRRKIDAVWMFRNKMEPINSGYAGFLYACGLKGLLKELPMLAIMDMLKSGVRTVQIGILVGLGLSYRGQYVDAIERVLSMHIRSHFMNTVKIQISADIQGAALLGYGFMYYNSCDRQAIKTLFAEFQRDTSQHDKTTIAYPPSFYLNAAIAIGMVSSVDMRNSLTGPQMDALLSIANGHESDSDRAFAAIVALMLGALGTGDKALANCLSLQDKHNCRPYFWFMKHLCRLSIEWTEVVTLGTEWTDEYSIFESAAKYLYSAIRCQSDDITGKLLDSLSSLERLPIKATEGLAIKRLQSAKEFAMDVCLLSLCIANNASRDARILRHLARQFSSCLQYNHGRSVMHSMAAGFLCLQNGQRLDLTDHFTISSILISSLPVWSRDFVDMTCYFVPLRYLWALAVTTENAGTGRRQDSSKMIMEASTILCENALFHAFTHNNCPWTPQQLADMFKKEP